MPVFGQLVIYLMHFICIVSAIIGNVQIAKVSDAIFVNKRSLSILFGLNATLIFMILSLIPGFIARIYSNDVLFVVSLGLSTIPNNLFLFFSITKSWMIYFKERWTFFTLQLQWQQHIAPIHNSNWFILNNYRFGSLYYMYRVFGSWTLFVIALAFIGFIGSYIGAIHQITAAVLMTVPFLLSIVIYCIIICKTHRLALMDDIFFIHWEATLHARILCCYVAIFIMHQFVVVLVLINDIVWESFIFTPLYCLCIYALHHISTYGIIRKNYHYLSVEPSISIIYNNTNSPTNKKNRKLYMRQIMSNSEALHLFVLHITREYSLECLLAYIEMVQYQEYILDTVSIVDIDVIKDYDDNERKMRLPPDVPVSAIVAKKYDNVDDEESIKLKGYELYKKYIEETSEFEINIPWDQRASAYNIFENKQHLLNHDSMKIKDIFKIFNQIKGEMFWLLNVSYSRFKQHPEYEKVVALFDDNVV